MFIKRQNATPGLSVDYQKELEELLGAQHGALIREAQANYSDKKGQYSPEGSEQKIEKQADPVMMFNGQYVHTSQDVRINGAGFDFVFTRTYKNQSFYDSPLGFNWDHSFNLWLREEGNSIVRSSGELREDRYVKHEQHDYYVPPAGYHDCIEQEADSFVLRTPGGVRYIYERIGQTNLHRIRRVRDRNDNYLAFDYDAAGRLSGIEVNEASRRVEFRYDTSDRITHIVAYPVTYRKRDGPRAVPRVWRYAYDDFGDLVAVTAPGTDRYPAGLTTRYEYSSSSYPGELAHNLLRIFDPAGQLYLENEFGMQKGVLGYNRVVRQRQGNGEYYFEYEDVIPERSWDYAPEEIPAHCTIMYQRNGHPVEHFHNSLGNLIVKREKILDGCGTRELVSRYRYNKDGALIASLSPEGSVIQNYYGREDFYSRRVNPGNSQREPWQDSNLTQQERARFGNLLGVVKRGRYYGPSQMNLARGWYGAFFPSVFATDPEDVVDKYAYERDYQQIASASDPRYTASIDPRHLEVTNPMSPYNRHLTRYEYYPLPRKNLKRITYPNTTFPAQFNGSNGRTSITEEYLRYDAKGRLERVRGPMGSVTEYEYFEGALAGGARDGYVRKVVRDVNNLGLTTTYEVNEAGVVESATDPRGIQTKSVINELNQVIESLSGGPGFQTRHFFDPNGLLERQERDNLDGDGQRSPEGNETRTFEYDAQNNLLRETVGGTNLTEHHVTQHRYDTSDKRVETVLPQGNTVHYKYDERLLPRRIIRGACSSVASATHTFYDGDGRRVAAVDGRSYTTHFRYDALGRVISVTDALGHVRQHEHDKLDNIIIERFFEKRPNNEHWLLSRNEYEYDERGSKIREVAYLFEEPIRTGNVTGAPDSEFTAAQNRNEVTAVETQYFYDKNKRLFRVLNGKGQETTYEYDGVDRRVREQDADGNYSRISYDENSNVTRVDRHELVRDPPTMAILREDVFSTVNEYDDLDRLEATIDGLGNRTGFTYDSRDNVVTVTDALGNVKRSEYNVFNQEIREVAEVTETGLGGGPPLADIITQFTYDEYDNLASIVDARNAETRFEYDALDRLVRTTYADKSNALFEYDADDNLTVNADNNGLQVHFGIDPLGRKTWVQLDKTGLPPGRAYPVGVEEFEEYEYDGLGRALLQRNDFCETHAKYDSFGRAYEERVRFATPNAPPAGSFVLRRTFDVLSNRTGLVYPSRRRIRYDYDAMNRLKKIRNVRKGVGYPGSSTFPSEYDIANYEYRGQRLENVRYGNQTGYELDYDGLGRIISTKHHRGGTLLLRIQQLYDGAGNRRFQRYTPAVGGSPNGETYKYDSLYRLTKFERRPLSPINRAHYAPPKVPLPLAGMLGQQKIDNAIGPLAQDPLDYTYEYDTPGNREEERQPGQASITYVANSLNQYTSRGATLFQYDLNGNLIDDGTRRYLYNYKNQLVRAQDKATNTNILELYYDAFGRVVAVREGASTLHLINDGLNILEEYSSGNLVSQYVYENGVDRRCQMVNGSEEWWYHRDVICSTRLLSNSSGQVPADARYEYGPFGSTLRPLAHDNRYLFAGKRFFETVDLYHSLTRQYSPVLGRFLQRDPKGMVDGPNLYVYAANNPATFVDLMGTEKGMAEAEEHPAARHRLPPAQQEHTGPSIVAMSENEIRRIEAERILNLDMPPEEAFPIGEATEARIPYAILYGLKHSFYVPIREWISPTPIYYLGPGGVIKEWTGQREHTDALIAIAQLGTMFIPTPKPGLLSGASGASASSMMVSGRSITYFTIQSEAGTARLLSGGQPWPTGVSKSLLGKGLYSWETRAQAEAYKLVLEQRYGASGLRTLEPTIMQAEYKGLRALDLRTLDDVALESFMETHSLYGQGLPHTYQHLVRETGNFGPEHYFSEEVFRLFGF